MTLPAVGRPALPLAEDCCAPLLREPLTSSQAAGGRTSLETSRGGTAGQGR
jgi:hypothetical protein